MRTKLGRRSLLRGAIGGAAVSIGLPILDIMLDDTGTALAQDGSQIIRFGTFYWGGGIVHSEWVPGTTGTGWDLPGSLQPFQAVRDYVTLSTGDNHAGSSPGHIPARGLALSSSHDLNTNISGVGTYRGQQHPEPSVDALVAEHWSGRAPYDLITVGICRKGPYRSNSSWQRGGAAYNRHEPSPQALFDRLFGGATTPTEDPSESRLLQATQALERSMLDAVREDAARLQRRLGARDRARLEQHLDGIRALERRIMEVGVPGGDNSCLDPDRPIQADFGDGSSNEQKEAKAQLMSAILAHALACDLTRVFSYEWSSTQSEAVYWEVDVDQDHHNYNHASQNSEGMKRIIHFIMQNFAYLAEQLHAMPEGDGTVLDNTLILGTSEHANAGAHNYNDHPYIFVGGAGGRIRRGFHRRGSGRNDAPRSLLTAVHAVGLELDGLGQESNGRRVTEPFSELLV